MTATPATVIQIAESVVAEINAGDFSKKNLAAQRLYVPNFDLEDMKELRVTVVPREVEYLPLDRASNKFHATIDVAVQKKFSKGDAKEIDPLGVLCRGTGRLLPTQATQLVRRSPLRQGRELGVASSRTLDAIEPIHQPADAYLRTGQVIQIRTHVRFSQGPVQKKVQTANFRSLGHAAGTIRLTAKRSIRKRKKPSSPGSPPHTQTGMLRRVIRYEVNRDREEAVIGPVQPDCWPTVESARVWWRFHETPQTQTSSLPGWPARSDPSHPSGQVRSERSC